MNFPKQNYIVRSHFLFLISFLMGILILVDSSYSQDYQSFQGERDSIVDGSKIRLGPILLDLNFLLNLFYDSNMLGQVSPDNPVGDYYAMLSVPFKASLLYRKWLITSFTGTPAYNYYFKFANERSLNGNYSAGARLLLFNRFSLSGNYVFSKERERLTREMDRRVSQTSRGYNYGIFFDTARNTSFGFSGSSVDYSYEDTTLPGTELPLFIALDRTAREGQIEFYYRFLPGTQFFANFGYAEYSFANPESAYRDSHSYQAYSGIRFPVMGSRARGAISLGYKKFIPEQQGFEGFSGIVGDTSFSIRVGRFDFTLMFVRDIPFSYGTNIFFVNDSYGGGLSFYLNEYVRLSYNYSKGTGDYPAPQEIISPEGNIIEIRRTDTYESHAVGVVFRVYRNIGIGLSAEFSKRNSNYLQVNIDITFVGAYLTYEF